MNGDALFAEAIATVQRLKADVKALKLDNLNLRVRLARERREAAKCRREVWALAVKLEQASQEPPPLFAVWMGRTGPGVPWTRLPHYTMDNVKEVAR